MWILRSTTSDIVVPCDILSLRRCIIAKTKICHKCGEEKDLWKFRKSRKHYKNGTVSAWFYLDCLLCVSPLAKSFEITRKWREENRGHGLTVHQTPPARYTILKGRHNKYYTEPFLSFEDYLQLIEGTNCSYCKRKLLPSAGGGLDRLDNSRGYTKDNVVPCCGICNIARGDNFSVEEMKILGATIAEILDKRPPK